MDNELVLKIGTWNVEYGRGAEKNAKWLGLLLAQKADEALVLPKGGHFGSGVWARLTSVVRASSLPGRARRSFSGGFLDPVEDPATGRLGVVDDQPKVVV